MSLKLFLDEVEALKAEYEKFERGNKRAGTRCRKILQNIKKLAQELRIHIQQIKNLQQDQNPSNNVQNTSEQ